MRPTPSNGGLIVIPTTPIYATSKSAVSALTEALHYQLVGLGAKIRAREPAIPRCS